MIGSIDCQHRLYCALYQTCRAEWVLSACKAQADHQTGQTRQLRDGCPVVRRAGEAAQAAAQLEDYQENVKTLRDEHYQKYKLRPMLEGIG